MLALGDGITIEGETISVTMPVKGVTQAEYDGLPEEERKGLFVITDSNTALSESGEVYSTEETRIGTWIDGKPLYRKVFYDNSTRIPELNGVLLAENVDFLVHQYGVLIEIDSEKTSVFREGFPYASTKEVIITQLNSNNDLRLYVTGNWSSYILNTIFEYTKTTDQGVSA